MDKIELNYMSGFDNDFETEALPGALPQGQNSPQRAPYGLYAEQFSNSAFTVPRALSERSWLYRIRPSVKHVGRFNKDTAPNWKSAPDQTASELPIGLRRWDPVPVPNEATTLITGIHTMTTAGDVTSQTGMAAHLYLVNTAMTDEYLINADGEMLFVPQNGRVQLTTEMGILRIEPGEIAVIPRGMIMRFEPLDANARGYICENYGSRFVLPERGPIGSNGLANSRDFKTPVAAYEDRDVASRIHVKWCGQFYVTESDHSPLDVVAWHGNCAPYKYDLSKFSPVGAILFDHPDPSIFTVLTAPSGREGTANIDFAIFPPRWMVAENTFRPPWFHRNVMSEFMGLIKGEYDAKEAGFEPGGMSLHNMMLPHGPDAGSFEKASNSDLAPEKIDDTLAIMFETCLPQQMTKFAGETGALQEGYLDCWNGLEKHFDGTLEGNWRS